MTVDLQRTRSQFVVTTPAGNFGIDLIDATNNTPRFASITGTITAHADPSASHADDLAELCDVLASVTAKLRDLEEVIRKRQAVS